MSSTPLTSELLDARLEEMLRAVDEKVNFLIALLCARKSLSEEDQRRIQAEYQIFPSIS